MKKIFYIILLGLLPVYVMGQTTILDHEAPATTTTFTYFGNGALDGTSTAVISNPDASGLNTSANVGEFVRNAGALTFAGCFGNPAPSVAVDLTTDNIIRVKVWMDKVGTFSVKLEGSTSGAPNWLGTADVTTPNTWVELEYDANQPSAEAPFNIAAGGVYTQVVLFADLGEAATGVDQFTYFDDLSTDFVFSLSVIDLPITWEDGATVDYTVTDFGGNVSTLVADPTDATNTVMSSNKPATAEFFAGTTMSTPAGLANPIALSNADTRVSMRVYSPDAGIPVRLKVENAGDPTISVETEELTTTSGAWETMIFDFANEVAGTAALNVTATYNKASVFFNFGTDGPTAGDKTYLWDDVEFIGGGGTGLTDIDLPITWDDPAVSYVVTDFGGLVTTLFVADPFDATNNVALSNKPVDAEFFAGVTMSSPAGFANAIPVTATESIMTIRVFPPAAGLPVRLKIEDATDPTLSVETEVLTTVAGTWETMVFDFNNEVPGTTPLNPAVSFTKASVFFNFGTDGATAGDQIWFWDDVMFGAPAPVCDNSTAPINLTVSMDASGATLGWDPIANSVGCLVNGGPVGGPLKNIKVPGMEVSSVTIPAGQLTAATDYNWRVTCGCNMSDLDDTTPYSVIDVFTWMPAPRLANVQMNNPANDVVILNMEATSASNAIVTLFDLSGKTVKVWNQRVEEGANTLYLNSSDVQNGMYILSSDDLGIRNTVVIQH